MKLILAICVAIFVYLIQQKIYRRMWDKSLDVSISFPEEYIEEGEMSALIEVVNNNKFLPLPVFHVKFAAPRSFRFSNQENASVTDLYYRNDVFSVMGNQKITRQLDFVGEKRGFYSVTGINIIAKDFFMTKTFAKNITNHANMYVFPQKLTGPKFKDFSNVLIGEIENRKSLYEDPYTFSGIREYDRGDSMNRINWKATARNNQLMVNIYAHASEQPVKILLNLETHIMLRPEIIRELCISFAASISESLLANKIPVMFSSNGEDMITKECESVNAGASMNHLISINKCLARIDKNRGIDSFFDIVNGEIKSGKTNTSYVVISPYYKEDLLLKLDYMVSKGICVKMLVPYYDIQEFVPSRDYMYGWEVKYDET